MKNKKRLLVLLGVLASSLFAFSACDLFKETDSSSSSGSSIEESSAFESSSDDDSSQSSDSVDSTDREPEELPPVIVKTETDALGHEIVYYEDGTWKDNGRVTPLDLSVPAVEEQYAYNALAEEKNGENLCALYEDLFAAAVEFSASDIDVENTEQGYVFFTYDHTMYELSASENVVALKSVMRENPAFYWWERSTMIVGTKVYCTVDEAYVTAEARAAANEAIEEMALDCDTYLNGKMSLTERALTIYEYVIDRVAYAYEEDGVTPETENWAHNIVGAAVDGAGVCETYASTFEYLCDAFGLPCITVEGRAYATNSEEAHAWNYLYLDDEWRAVDVTWGGGATVVDRSWFGTAAAVFSTTHTPDTSETEWGIEQRFALPVLSENALCPVLFSDGENEPFMVSSFERAFEMMTDENGWYTLTVYSNTNVTGDDLRVYPVGASFSGALPTVGQLRIAGVYLSLEENDVSVINARLNVSGDLSLSSNLVLQNLYLSAGNVAIGDYTLTLGGKFITLNNSDAITSGESGLLLVEPNCNADITGATLTNVAIGDSAIIKVRGDSVLKNVYFDMAARLELWRGNFCVENVTVRHDEYGIGAGFIWIEQMLETQTVEIGNVYVGEDAREVSFQLYVNIEDVEKYPDIRFTGKTDSKEIKIAINGRNSYIVTDPSGEIVNRYETQVSPKDIVVPIFNIEKMEWSVFSIYYVEWEEGLGFNRDKTYMYEVNEDGDVVLKEEYANEDELV